MDAHPAAADLNSITSTLAGLMPDVLVAVDFDGTLAPLVAHPEDSRPVAGAIQALTALAESGARVAVITGRDARTVLRLGGFEQVPGIAVSGLYGAETWQDAILDSPDTPEAMALLQQRLPELLHRHGANPKVWIEDKRLSLVVHGRLADNPEAVLDRLREPIAALAAELHLELHPGSGVLELRLPGYDKAGALRRLIDARPTRGVLYLGEDIGDLPAFAEVRLLREEGVRAYGVGVLASGVTEIEAAADACVHTADDAVALLRAIGGPAGPTASQSSASS